MRALGSSVLVFQWIVLALAIPVAINVEGVAVGTAWLVFALITVLVLAAVATLRRPAGVALGWAVQVAALSLALVVPILGILGLLFAGLWFAAIRIGRRTDALRAAAQAP